MTINRSLVLLGLFFSMFTFGQGEADNWYFGGNAGITFNSDGTATPLTNGVLDTFEGCATISSPSGDLLFYTDGSTVYDRNHNPMPNGNGTGDSANQYEPLANLNGLFGNESSTQAAIIVPWPENPELYIIFTTRTKTLEIPGPGLNYSVVDMTLNGGFGDIDPTRKNINLLADCAEKLTAVVKDCRTNSLWVIAFGTDGSPGTRPFNTYHAFEVTPAGVSLTSVQSLSPSLSVTRDGAGGYLKLSPDGTKLASANTTSGLFLYDFDANTGIASNEEQIFMGGNNLYAYGIEFSPNSRYLYVNANNLTATTSGLHQFDTQAANISGQGFILDNSRNFTRGALQLGPNGKIYRALSISYLVGTPSLGVIENPDTPGAGANYQHNSLGLAGRNSYQGLPPFVQSFFNTVDVVDDTGRVLADYEVCEGDPLMLQTQYLAGATYEWVNGSGQIVTDTDTDGHILNRMAATLTDTGQYTVTIIKPDAPACPITGTLDVIVHPLPTTTSDTLFVCDTDGDTTDGLTTVDLTQLEDTANFTYTYYETLPDRNAGTNPIGNPTAYSNTTPGSQPIYYTAESLSAACPNAAQLQLEIGSIAPFTLDPNYFICAGNPTVALIGPAGYDTYEWVRISDLTIVSTVQDATIDQVGDYRLVTGSNHTLLDGSTEPCTTEVTFAVLESNLSVADLSPNGETVTNGTFTICQNQSLTLGTNDIPGALYEWTLNGVALTNTGNTYTIASTTITDAGDYEVTVTDPAAASCPVNAALNIVIDATVNNAILEMQVCDTDLDNTNDGFTNIDLTQSADPAFTYTYYESASDRDTGANQIADPTNFRNDSFAYTPTVYFSTISAAGCDGIGELQLTVNAVPSLLVERNHWLCPENPTVSISGPNGYDTYQWYRIENTGRQLYASNQIAQFTEVGVFILEASNDFTLNGVTISCSSSAEIEVLSSALSIADLEANGNQATNGGFTVCEGQPLVLRTEELPGAIYTWEKDGIPIVNPNNHFLEVDATTTTDAGNYLVTVTGTGPLTCPVRGTIDIIVDPLLVLTNDTILSCDTDTDNPTDGLTTLDLTQIENDPNFSYSYFESEADREVNSLILNPENYRNSIPFDQTIYIKTINGQGCENFGEIQLQIQTAPEFVLEESYGICATNADLVIEGPEGFNSYTWYNIDGATDQLVSEDQNFAVSQIGEYMLSVSIDYTNNGQTVSCLNTAFFSVQQSEAATIDDIAIDGNSINNSIQVSVSGNGNYEFSIDGSTYQDSNSFDNIPSGETTVYVNDKNGCGTTEETIEIELDLDFFGFPKFFTPNSDGTNDYWQYLPPPDDEIDLKTIFIYNRYGNLLAQIDPSSNGWDGELNGTPLPSTDYWFMALTNDQGQIRGHFSLKR